MEFIKWLFTRWYFWVVFIVLFLVSFIANYQLIQPNDYFSQGIIIGIVFYPLIVSLILCSAVYWLKKLFNKKKAVS